MLVDVFCSYVLAMIAVALMCSIFGLAVSIDGNKMEIFNKRRLSYDFPAEAILSLRLVDTRRRDNIEGSLEGLWGYRKL